MPPELRWQSGRLLTDRSSVRSRVGASFLVYSFHCYLVITFLFVFTPTTFIVTLIVTLIVTIHSKLGS